VIITGKASISEIIGELITIKTLKNGKSLRSKIQFKTGRQNCYAKKRVAHSTTSCCLFRQNHLSVDLIAENKQGYGVRIITAEQFFSKTSEIIRIERFRAMVMKGKERYKER